MHKNVKRILSLVLTFVMLLGIIPFVPQVSAATADTEAASDMLASASYAWSAQDWTGAGQFSYANDSTVTNGEDSLRSWRFSATAKESASYARLQISLGKSYDMTGKDLVFDVKADTAKELTSYSMGIVPYGSDWKPVHDYTNYLEYQVYFKGSDWTTVTVDNSILKAFLQDGRDLSSILVLYLSFNFPAGGAQNIYIDNMRLVDHNYGTDAQDAAADLLANAEVVENGANGTTYTYEHTNKTVAYGNESNASHKFAAASGAADMFTVKYDLGKSYDLNNRNFVMDILSYRGGNGYAFSLYNSKNELVSYAECYTTVNEWAEVRPAILAGLQSGKNLSDVRYVAIGARFASNTSRADRAFYVDNLRIEDIDVHSTALQDKNIVFLGDSITAAYGYKGWAGELQEHYGVNSYNIGVGGASYATLSGRTTIYAQKDKIPNVDVDFFVLNGGVNDIWSKANLGAVSSISVAEATVNSFDTNTTAGAMEQMFCYLTKNYPDSKIAFLINYFCYSVEIDNIRFRDEFAPLAKEICEKWGITWIDLTDNTEINALRGVHTYDGVHGNDIAYELVIRELAPVLVGMCGATEQTEQNSDLLAYATYAWSAENWNGNLSYDAACTNVFGSESTRSWKFSASDALTGNAGIQLMLHNLHNFTLTGKKLAFDVKFESSNGQSAQDIGLRLYDRTWKSVTGDNTVWVGGNGSTQWQTITVDASVFEQYLAGGCDLNEIRLVYFQFNFADNAGNQQNIYIDNFRVVGESATNATEEASDLLYGAGFVDGSITGEGMAYEQFNTALTYGADSKYSYRFYIEDDKTAWATATFMLPESIDLTESTLQFNVNQYNQVALWVALFDSNYQQVTSDNYTLRDIGWQTYEINALYGLAEGRTAEDLSDIRYIRFSFNFAPADTGRTVVIDNLSTYKNAQYSSVASGLNGLYLGDSVSEATNYKGWHGEMAEHYGITGYNVSVGGRTLANDGIYSELANVPADMEFDFIMLDGGVNDYWSPVAPGVVTPEGTTSFDATTPIGGLEKLFYTFRTQYPDAEVFYIILYLPNWTSFYKDHYVNEFLPLAKQACEKWGVHVLDLTSNEAFLEEFDVTAEVHTFDGLHANKEGFDIITPYVVSMLEEAMCADASIRYQQLSLGDDLSMRFDIAVSGAYADSAAVTVTVDGNAVMESVSYASLADGVTGCKKFALDMAAAQMSDEIVITISDGDTVLVEKTYTVRDYIKALLEGNYDAKLQELAKAALNYGAGAQVYFDHNADNLANAGYESTEAVEIPDINTENMIAGEVSGIRFYGASLVYTSKIAVRYYFTVNGDISSYTFSNGNAPVLKDGKYYVEVDGINPQEYAKEIALTVSSGSEEMTVTYSPLYYISRMYNKTDKQSLKTLLGAMYNYHIAANDYVNQEVIRGTAFTAGKSTIFDVVDGEYDIVSFDYKLEGDGEMAAIIRGTQWTKFYGDFRLTNEGEKVDYVGITTEKLDDGYIRVTFDLAALERTGCVNNRDGAPTDVNLIDIYDWTTANGYLDNIQLSNKEPEEVVRGERFTAGKDTFFYVETGSYKYVTFDYKPDEAGELAVIIRGSAWIQYFGDFRLTEAGEKVDYAGVTTEVLPDGYIRATFDLEALNRSGCVNNRDNAPTDVALIDIYNWSTVGGYLDNIQLSNEKPGEEPEQPVVRGETFSAGVDNFFYLETPGDYDVLTFDYKTEGSGEIAVILRGTKWSTFYGDFRLTENGEKKDYAGITTEILPDGYIRATFKLKELQRSGCVDNRDSAPVDVKLIDIYNWSTVGGYLDNIQVSNETPEVEEPGNGELVTVTFADVQLMTSHRGNTVNGPKALLDHLNYAKSINADVLFMPGDVVNNADQGFYDRFWTIFKSVYGEDESLWPEIIWAMGNHEWYDANENDASNAIALFKANAHIESSHLVKMSQVPSEANPGQTIANYYKVVNGVPFVVISGDSRANRVSDAQKAELITWLDEISQLPTVQAGTPIYVAYHLPIADVTYFGQGATEASRTVDEILKNYPNAIVFTGDTHCPGINERTINQIDYTSINLGSSSYSRIVKRSATSQEGDKYYNVGGNAKDVVTGEVAFGFTYTQNLMVLENSADGSVVMNRYITDTEPSDIRKVGITWNFPSGMTKNDFIYTNDRFENKEWANILYGKDGLMFPDDASISFSVDGTEMIVYFDDVTDHNYAEHYKITVTVDGVNTKTYDLVGNYFKYYEESQTYHFLLSDIPVGTNYKVEVKAYDFFDNESLNSLVATTESAVSLFPNKIDNAVAGTYTDISTKVNYEITAGGVSSLECYYRGDYLYTYGATLGTVLDKNNLALSEEFTVTDWSHGILTMKVKNAGEVSINVGPTVVVNENGTEKWVTDFGSEYRKVVKANSDWVELTWDLNELFGIDALADVSAIRLKVSSTAPSEDGYTMHLFVDDVDIIQGEHIDTEEPGPVVRGETFTGGTTKTIYLPDSAMETLAFDYQLTTDGDMHVILRAPDWKGFYGDYEFNAEGEVTDYDGITTEKLEDGYIRVYVCFAELGRTGCVNNRDSAPASVGIFDIYSWGTADGYIDNILLDVELPDADVIRGKAFSAGVDNFFYLDTAGDYTTLSFDYKTEGSGEIAVILRGTKWSTYYGDYRLTEKGEKVDYVGVTTENLKDGYIRVTFNLKELQRSGCIDNRNNAPVDIKLIDLYNWTTVSGYIDNITVS